MDEERTHTGGATFSPQLNPRPEYPPVSAFLKKAVVAYTRAPMLMAIATKLAFPQYLKLVERLKAKGWSEAGIFMLATCAVHSGLYTVLNGSFYLLEKLGLLEQYRMAHKKSQAPSPQLMRKTLLEAALGQLALGPLVAYYGHALFVKFGMLPMTARLPSLLVLYKHFAIAHFFNDFFFYWAHRIVHSKSLYKVIHKQHHSFLGSKGMAAEYANPIEQVLANFGPTVGGVLLFGRHPLVFLVWLTYRLEETYEAHSNYFFGNTFLGKLGLTNAEHSAFHSAHHSINRGNFGSFHMDWLFGTMDDWVVRGGVEGYTKERLGKHVL